MVTWYYLNKFNKNEARLKKYDYDAYYRDLRPVNTALLSYPKTKYLCRVCLRKGNFEILENKDIIKVLHTLGGIQLSESDDNPKYLCDTCNNFLRTCIRFREIAKQTEEFLLKSTEEEKGTTTDNYEQSEDHDYDNNAELDDSVEWQADFGIKEENKREKIKHPQKSTCNICNKIINRSYIKEHLTMHDPDHQKYVCEVCGKSFRLRCAYHNHSLRHRKDFPFKCQFCPYRGRYSELLKTHMRTHTGDYRYMCTECPARFLFKSNLNSHMLKHKDPQYKCDACKRAFHTKLKLQRHFEADHLGIRNHVCSLCGKAFGYRNAMLKHQRHVHKREKATFTRMPSYLQTEDNLQTILHNQ